MNKINKVILATLGGVDAIFNIATPILIALLWIKFSGLVGVSSNILVGAAIISSIYKAIRVGWFER